MDAMSENLAWGRERDEAFAKEQAAIAEERELASYREVEMELERQCDCDRVRAAGKLVCNPCSRRISAEVKEIVDRAFDEAAAELGMTRAEYSIYIWGNEPPATDSGLPPSLGPQPPRGTVPRDSSDA
jgi:hypothetical protein